MQNKSLAHRYANALFSIAVERNILSKVHNDIMLVGEVLVNNKKLLHLINTPLIETERKLQIFQQLFKDNIDVLTAHFLQLVIKKRRSSFFPAIIESFLSIYRDFNGIIKTNLTTAISIDQNQKDAIEKLLEGKMNKKIALSTKTDPSLMGGFILDFKDRMYDSSLKSKLRKLRTEILKK